MNKQFTICYFGIFDPSFSRNAVYIKGLEQNGVSVLICTDTSSGFKKYLTLITKFWKIRKSIDLIVVGYSGHVLVPFTKLLSVLMVRKPVIFDALCSFYESNILSRDAFKTIPLRSTIAHLIDWFANTTADIILVETEKQKEYYVKELSVPASKCIVALTGVNDTLFFYDETIKKADTFTVLFRGKFTPEAGLKHIIEAIRIIEESHNKEGYINFKIIGYGWGAVNDEIQNQIADLQKKNLLKNLVFINKHLPIDELRKEVLECHVSLGQFEDHERLQRTIPHKAFEALAMKLAYITAKTEPVQEILTDEETCLFVHTADPQDIVDKILLLKNDPGMCTKLIENGYRLYKEKLTPKELAKKLLVLLPHGN